MQFDVRAVARILQVPESKVYHWISDDNLPAKQVSGKYCVDRAELLEWATLRRMNLSSEAFYGTRTELLGTLAEALQLGGVVHNMAAGERHVVLRAVVDHMALPANFDRASLVELFLAREAIGSTAVGEGVAIPHPRQPVILPVARPALTICFLSQPVNFGARDGKPVHTLFVLVSPTIRAHMQMLAQIARALHDEPFREILRRRASQAEIMTALERVEQPLAQEMPAQPSEAVS
jgi:nitrogen PTS system EIIA component